MNLSQSIYGKNELYIPQTKSKKHFRKEYPSNPLEVAKELINLKYVQKAKLIISFIIIILFAIFNNIKIIRNPFPLNKCYYDTFLEWTKSLNSFFRSNDIYRIILTIIGSILLDIVFIVGLSYWALYAIDWRLAVNLILFYSIRGIIQQLLILDCPELLYFKYPNFPSIVVGYVQGSDFFFSGHCGFPIVVMMEFIWLKKFYFAGFCAFVTIFEAFLMFNCREHYTIDIIIGIIFAHYICIYGKLLINYIYKKSDFLDKLKNENEKELKRIAYDVNY